MGEKVVTLSERIFFMMIWVIIILALAGVLIHFASSKGLLPNFLQRGLQFTNLSQQAGS